MDIHRKSLRRKSKNIKATSGNESHEQQQEQQQQQHVVLLLCKLMLKGIDWLFPAGSKTLPIWWCKKSGRVFTACGLSEPWGDALFFF